MALFRASIAWPRRVNRPEGKERVSLHNREVGLTEKGELPREGIGMTIRRKTECAWQKKKEHIHHKGGGGFTQDMKNRYPLSFTTVMRGHDEPNLLSYVPLVNSYLVSFGRLKRSHIV